MKRKIEKVKLPKIKDREEENKLFKPNKIIIIISIVIVLLIGIFLIYLDKSSKFKYEKYDKKVIVAYKEKFDYSYPDVCYGNIISCKEVKPSINGKVDIDNLGKYKVEYKYKYKDKEMILKQDVIVKDMIEPELSVDEENIKVCPNGKILKLDMEASDNLDGDITDKIKTELKDNILHIEVEDSSSNKVSKDISVEAKDEVAPVITINGNKNVSMVVGLEYKDNGASAKDDCDGEVSVSSEGSVNTNEVGIYKITYTAKDSKGNKSTAVRTVEVKNRVVGNKVIYLTFDDGPGAYTKQLLDILDKYDVKVTFFVTNQFPKYQYLIGEEAKRGHTVAVHTLTHKWNIYDSLDAYMNDFNAMNDIIEQQTGSRTKIFRFPGGSSNTVYCKHNKTTVPDVANKMNELGVVYFDWNVGSGDAGGTTSSDQVYKNVIRGLKASNSVVLQHDIKSFSVNAVEDIIKYGLNNGYTFKKLEVDSPVVHHSIHICK